MHLLINWLWHVSALVLIVHVLVAPWRRLSAATRYGVWAITLGLLLVLPLRGAIESAAASWMVDAPVPAVSVPAAEPTAFALPELPIWIAVVLGCLWIEWVAFSAVRLARAIVGLSEARAACAPFPQAREARLPNWTRLGREGRLASLALSSRVRGAAVLGLRDPIIAVSPALADRLTDAELDQVIVHELAHVRRRDDLSAVAQALVDVLAGFHPAVRVVQARLALEREMACDDWVVRVTGSAKRYAACLTRVAEAQEPGVDLLAPAALAPAQLTMRVTRLLDGRRSRARASHIGLLVATPVLTALALVVTEFRLVSASRDETPVESLAVGASGVSEPAGQRTTPAVLRERGPVRERAIVEPQPQLSRSARVAAAEQTAAPSEPVVAAPLHAAPPRALSSPSPELPAPSSVIQARGLTALDAFPHAGDVAPEPAAPAVAEEESSESLISTATLVAPWQATAHAGVAIGQGSQRAAVATAGFVTRVSKSIARVF